MLTRTFKSLLLAALLIPALAWATLGQTASSVDGDALRLQARRIVTTSAGYTVHELQQVGGTVVREFVAPGGQVFAITWRGPNIPDLQLLLGPHYARYLKAAQAGSPSRRPVRLNEPDLVIGNAGHARSFHGAAYLPQQLPAGFDLGLIR